MGLSDSIHDDLADPIHEIRSTVKSGSFAFLMGRDLIPFEAVLPIFFLQGKVRSDPKSVHVVYEKAVRSDPKNEQEMYRFRVRSDLGLVSQRG